MQPSAICWILLDTENLFSAIVPSSFTICSLKISVFFGFLTIHDSTKLNQSAIDLTLKQMPVIDSTHGRTQVYYLWGYLNILHHCLTFLPQQRGKKKTRMNQISTLSASIFPILRILKRTHSDRTSDMHPGWRLIPAVDESRHDGSEAYNVIYGARLTFQIQSGTLITDENLRQEIALIANENLTRHKSTDVCKCAQPNKHWAHQNLTKFD